MVEDEPSTRQAWCELIVSWGFKVAAARDGQEGFEMAHSFEPDIVLADLKMPHKDGLTLLRELREAGLNIATIIISGEGDIPEAVRAIKQGAYDYLRKPVDPQHLRVLLNNLAEHLNVSAENTRLRRRLMGAGELGPDGRPIAAGKAGDEPDRTGRAVVGLGRDHRRERHRQRACRADDP